jgi:hypothetical protein
MATVFPAATTRFHAGSDALAGRAVTALLWLQGGYYLLTGIWPLVSIRTFQLVTGPKTDHLPTGREADHWLVMTAGVLITSISLPLVISAWRRRAPAEVIVLAISAAAGLACIDVIYVLRDVIAPIYLLDAAIQIPLIAAWLLVVSGRGFSIPERGRKSG